MATDDQQEATTANTPVFGLRTDDQNETIGEVPLMDIDGERAATDYSSSYVLTSSSKLEEYPASENDQKEKNDQVTIDDCPRCKKEAADDDHNVLEKTHEILPPPGLMFCPTDEELIGYYLKEALNEYSKTERIIFADAFACNPHKLTDSYKLAIDQKEWFFINERHKKYSKGDISNRETGTSDGYWKASTGVTPIENLGKIIGSSRSLNFYLYNRGKSKKDAVKTVWIMKEYRLIHDNNSEADLILCKIYHTPRKNAELCKRKAEQNIDELAIQVCNEVTAEVISPDHPQPNDNAVAGNSNSIVHNHQEEPAAMTEEELKELKKGDEYFNNLSPGFLFSPSDEDILIYYLWRRAEKLVLPVNKIRRVDIYSCGPQTLTEMYELSRAEREWYFFQRNNLSVNGKKLSNRATAGGEGYWRNINSTHITIKDNVTNGGRSIVGQKVHLNFYAFEGKSSKNAWKTDWLMHEYRLLRNERSPGTSERTSAHDTKFGELVLCKVYEKVVQKLIRRKKKEEHINKVASEEENEQPGVP